MLNWITFVVYKTTKINIMTTTNQFATDFLNTRNEKVSLLSQIETIQSNHQLALELDNVEESEKLDSLLDELFNKMYDNQDVFEAKYELDYNEVETSFLVDGVIINHN